MSAPRLAGCLIVLLAACFALPSRAETITGKVVDETGKPMGWLTVAMALKNHCPRILNGGLENRHIDYFSTETDNAGRFSLPSPWSELEDYKLFVLHSVGFAQVSKSELESQNGVITFGRWARIEGMVKAKKGLSVSLQLREENDTAYSPRADFDCTTTVSGTGEVVFRHLPPGKATAYVHISWGKREDGSMGSYLHKESVNLVSGETVSLNLDVSGRTVIGKLTLPDDFEGAPNWGYCYVTCNPRMEEALDKSTKLSERLEEWKKESDEVLQNLLKTRPENINNETDEEVYKHLWTEWLKTDAGKRFSQHLTAFTSTYMRKSSENYWQSKFVSGRRTCVVSPDGTFRLEDIPVGDWELDIKLYEPPPPGPFCGQLGLLGSTSFRITVPDKQSDAPLDIGTLAIEKALPGEGLIAAGAEAPDFELKRLGVETEEMIKLSDYRGKTVILDFWATWCGPCINKMPELVKLHERIKDNPNVVLLGISIDQDERTLLNFLAKKPEMTWGQLRTAPNAPMVQQYGVFAIPAMVVVGADGKVVAVNPNLSALMRMIDE